MPDRPNTAPDTVVLVHGLWMTPRSWEGWVAHYEAKGLTVVAPAYPGFEIEVEALRENPDIIANLTVTETVDHLAKVIESLSAPPIIMGHSFGGTLTQLLLARGLGAAGVVVDSAPTEGVRVNPISQARSQLQAGPPGHLGRLRRRPGTAAVHRRGEGPHHAAVGEQVERQALRQVARAHRLPRVPGPRSLDLCRSRVGGGRRPRPGLGAPERVAGDGRRHELRPASLSRRRSRSSSVSGTASSSR